MQKQNRTEHAILARAIALAAMCLVAGGAAAQVPPRIASPVNGATVTAGGTLTVTVEATPFAFQDISIAGPPFGWSEAVSAPPYVFQIAIPKDTPAGLYTIHAIGNPGTDQWSLSESIDIDIEPPGAPQELSAVLTSLSLDGPGDTAEIQLKGNYADGSSVFLTHSTNARYRSDYPEVATVDANGLVTAVAPGYGILTATYGNLELPILVTVPESISVQPDAAVVYAGGRQQFIPRAQGGAAEATVTWSLGDAEPGSIDETGLYTAPATVTTPRTLTVTATDTTDPTRRGIARIWLYPPATLSLTPAAVSLGPSGMQSFTAKVDNPANALVVWSATPAGVGNLNRSTGEYWAPETIDSPQTVTITAMAMTEPVLTAVATVSLVPVVEAISKPNPPAGPTSGDTGALYQFTASGAVSNLGKPIQYSFNWGDGEFSGWTPSSATSSFHSWATPGTYQVRVLAGSRTDPNLFSRPSEPLTVVIGGESITPPQAPMGPDNVVTGTSYTYSTSGATSSAGHPIQYKLFFGDGSTSPWLPVGTTSTSHSWVGSGTYAVTAQARCANDKQVMSAVSSELTVTAADGEAISTPDAPSGLLSGSAGIAYTYSTGNATASNGNPVVYLFVWGDGTTSGWLPPGISGATHKWLAPGTYTVTVLAADQFYLPVRSAPSAGTVVLIQ